MKYYQVITISNEPGVYDEEVNYEGYDLEEAREVLDYERNCCRDKQYKHELRECWLPRPADFMSEEELCDALSTYAVLENFDD